MHPLTILTQEKLSVHVGQTPVQAHPPPELTHLLPPLVTATSSRLFLPEKALLLAHPPLTLASHSSHLAVGHNSCINVIDLAVSSVVQTLPLTAPPISLSFQPTSDARYLACATSNSVLLFSRISSRLVSKFSHSSLTALAFSPAHPTLLAATDQTGCIVVWDISKALIKANAAASHARFTAALRAPATCLSFMKDGLLCVGGLDKQLRVLDSTLKRMIFSVTCAGPINCIDVAENVAAVGLTTGSVQIVRLSRTSGKVIHEVKTEGIVRAVHLWAGEILQGETNEPTEVEEWEGELFSPVVKTPAKGRTFQEERKRVGFVTPRAKTVHEVTSENVDVNGKGISEDSVVSEEEKEEEGEEEEISPSRRLPRGVLQSRNVGALKGAVPSLKVNAEEGKEEGIRRVRSESVPDVRRGREMELPRAGTAPGKEGVEQNEEGGGLRSKEVMRMGTPVREGITSEGQRVMTPVQVRWTTTAKQGRDMATVDRQRLHLTTPLRETIQRKEIVEAEPEDEVEQNGDGKMVQASDPETSAKIVGPEKESTIPTGWVEKLRGVLAEELGAMRDELRKDILNIHSELVVVAARHSEEVERAFTDRDRRIQQLEGEVERLRDDNRRLREKYGLMRIGGGS